MRILRIKASDLADGPLSRLSDPAFRALLAIGAAACGETGRTGLTSRDLAWRLRRDDADQQLAELAAARLVAVDDAGMITLVNRALVSRSSDDSARRVRAHREQRARCVTVTQPLHAASNVESPPVQPVKALTRIGEDTPVSAPAELRLDGGAVCDAVEILPCRGGVWPVPRSLADAWQRAYPNVSVEEELGKAWAWLDANPQQRPTLRGAKRFMQAWLSRTADRAAERQAKLDANGGGFAVSKTEAAYAALGRLTTKGRHYDA